jgi:hypothetical protein
MVNAAANLNPEFLFTANAKHDIAFLQGLKPTAFWALFGTTEVVP